MYCIVVAKKYPSLSNSLSKLIGKTMKQHHYCMKLPQDIIGHSAVYLNLNETNIWYLFTLMT